MIRPHVIKVGGRHLADPSYLDLLLERVRALVAERPLVLVHGGGVEIANLQRQLGLTPRTVDGLRVTTRESLDAVTMVLCGVVNKRVVAHFVHHGVTAVGVCGADGGLLRAPIFGKGELGRVGANPVVALDQLEALLPASGVLVLAPVSLGPDGDLLNVNADVVAQAVAAAVRAEVLEFVTDVDAVDCGDGPAAHLSPDEIEALVERQIIRGGMRPKMEAALAALGSGVSRVRIGSLNSLSRGHATEVSA